MIKVIFILLAIYFGVILYGELRQGKWSDSCWTAAKLMLIYFLWITK